MLKSDEYIEDRILWRLDRHESSEAIFPYGEMPENLKTKLQDFLILKNVGKPVLFFEGEGKTWTVLCTKGILFGSEDLIDSIEYNAITEHTIGDDPFNKFSDYHETNRDDFVKMEQHQILLKNENSQVFTLNTKKGGDIFTLYNILIMLLRMAGVQN